MLRWETIVHISNHILATLSGTTSAILVKWYLQQKAPGLQTFLDASIIEAANFSNFLVGGKFQNYAGKETALFIFSYIELLIFPNFPGRPCHDTSDL